MSSHISSNAHELHAINNASSSPILSLPDEVLCLVISIVAEEEIPDGGYYSDPEEYEDRVYLLGFLRLSEVCRRFRALLLSMHVSWASIVFDLPREPAALALARSHAAPMDVTITHLYGWEERNGTTGLDPDFEYHIATASQHASRIRSLDTYDLESLHHTILFSNPLPLLEDIHLTYTVPANPLVSLKDIRIDAPLLKIIHLEFQREDDSDDEDSDSDSEQGLSFFNEFDRGITLNCPALRSLEISVNLENATRTLEAGWIADLLCSSQLLESITLKLHTSGSRIHWQSLFRGRVARLVHLRNLELHGSKSANIPDLFARIDQTSSPRCSVAFDHFSFDDNSMSDLFHFIDFFLPMLRRSSQDALQLSAKTNTYDDDSGKSAMLNLTSLPALNDSTAFKSYMECRDSGLFEVWITFEFDGAASHQEHIIARIVDALRCDQSQLALVLKPAAWNTALDTIVKGCSTATELVVDYHWYHSEPALTLFPPSPDFLPNLDTMFIRFISTDGDSKLTRPLREHLVAWRKGLIVWLRRRAEAGLRVRRLHLLEPFTKEGDDWAEGVDGEDDDGTDAALRAQVAEFVDELVAERLSFEDWLRAGGLTLK